MTTSGDLLIHLRAGPDATAFVVEAEFSDGSRVADGRLVVDHPALLASEEAADSAAYGRLLFDALFTGALRTAFERVLPAADSGGVLRVRLAIDMEATELEGLRWERLYRERRGAWVPLATAGDSPFSRYRTLRRPEPLPIATLPVRILLAVSNPTGLPAGLQPIEVEQEIGRFREALRDAAATDDVEVTVLSGRTELTPALRRTLERDGFVLAPGPTTLPELVRRMAGTHVVHFVGHGGFRQPDEAGAAAQSALHLEGADGSWAPATADELVAALDGMDPPPALVYLSACESGRASDDVSHPFVALAPRLVDAGVAAAVAMQDAMPVVAARSLTQAFYSRLLTHGVVDVALNEARAVVAAAGGLDWTIPVLVSRLRGGRLLVRHELAGRVVSGDIALTPEASHGSIADRVPDAGEARRRPAPVLLLPRDFADLLGRDPEVTTAQTDLASGGFVEFHGPPGIGKTALLRRAANLMSEAPGDGVVFVPAAAEPPHDVLQFLFDALYEADASLRPTDAELERRLADCSPIVVFDDADIPRDALGRLLELVPRGRFLMAARDRNLWGEGKVVELRGLPAGAAVELFERALGRPLAPDERPRAEALCGSLGGHPLHILQAAAQAASGTWPSTAAAVRPSVSDLSPTERATLAAVAAAGAPVRIGRLEALVGSGDVTAAAARLESAGIIEATTGRYTLAEPLGAEVEEALDVEAMRRRLLDELVRWAEQNRNTPPALARDLDTIVGAIAAADQRSAGPQVLRLARAAEGALILAKRFDRWAEVLATQERLAAGAGDRPALGWVRHQQGTRALALGDESGASTALREALSIRTELNDVAGAAVTRHNLELLGPVVPPRGDGHRLSRLRRLLSRLRGPLGLAIGAVALATAGAVAAWAVFGRVSPPAPILPVLVVEPALDLGSVLIGDQRTATLTLTNASGVELTYTLVLEPPSTDLSVTDACGGAIPPRESCQVAVTFVPTASGSRGSTLVIDDNTLEGRHDVPIDADGAVPLGVAGLTLDPPALDFGAVPLKTPSTLLVTVTSSGDAQLAIRDVRTETGAQFFVGKSDCPGAQLDPGFSCFVEVVFEPGERLTYADTLVLEDNTDAASHTVPLLGSGLIGLADLRSGLDVAQGEWTQLEDGSPAIPVSVVVWNDGDAPADPFYIHAQTIVVDSEASILLLPLRPDPTDGISGEDLWRPSTTVPLGPGEKIAFRALLAFSTDLSGRHVGVTVLADSCATDEVLGGPMVEHCRVPEIDETNNLSNELPIDVPVFWVPVDAIDLAALGHSSSLGPRWATWRVARSAP